MGHAWEDDRGKGPQPTGDPIPEPKKPEPKKDK